MSKQSSYLTEQNNAVKNHLKCLLTNILTYKMSINKHIHISKTAVHNMWKNFMEKTCCRVPYLVVVLGFSVIVKNSFKKMFVNISV